MIDVRHILLCIDEVIDLTKDKDERDEDLEKAIALSLQESHSTAPQVYIHMYGSTHTQIMDIMMGCVKVH
jgi:hypothetical protein